MIQKIVNSSLKLQRTYNLTTKLKTLENKRYYSIGATTKRICIVGAGPAGFYAAQYILKQLQDCKVDVIEKLPVPFGLVR